MHATVYILSIALTIIAPILLALWLRRSFRVSWFLFGVGTLTFIGSQIVHLPLLNLLSKWGVLPANSTSLEGAALWQTAAILGLAAGICEEPARVLAFWLLKRSRKLEDSLMLGLGHGGIEAMILVGILAAGSIAQLFALRGQDLGALQLSPEQLTFVNQQMLLFERTPLLGFMPLVERLLAISLHVILTLMVFKAFQDHKPIWVVVAILYHTLVDFAAVVVANQTSNSLVLEVGFLAMILPGAIWAYLTFRKQARQRKSAYLPVEWGLFYQSLRKEMMQLWRTKMVWVILGVFALFGIVSPLLAYFMPQIFSSIEGAEMFKDLIPTPGVKDAIDQYVKNISQFGFLIAILVGMGKVAGEKEKGMTEMILHKPLPRWAFILSKFTAQALVYTAAFLIAELFAYSYTIYLFEPFSLAVFSWLNLLLLLWLLVFVATTTLGSSIARSSGTAAGISLGLAVVILISAQIPRYGVISPQALMAWAASFSTSLSFNLQTSNFTALGAAVVIIIMSLVWASGLFERQEI